MKKGVILEIKERYVTLLTPDGEFIRTRRLQQDYQIGEELYFYPMETEGEKVGHFLANLKGVKGKLVFSALIVLLAVVFIPIYQSNQVYAYMSIDVNPSIELGLNDQLLVVSMDAFNQEGEEVLEHVSGWKKETAAVVTKKILDEMEGMGYLNQEKEVLISTVNPDEETKGENLDETLDEIKKVTDKEDLEVTVVTATPAERENAVEQGITAGLYKQKQQVTSSKEDEKSNNGGNGTNHSSRSDSIETDNSQPGKRPTNSQGNGNGLDKEQKQQEKDKGQDKAQKQQEKVKDQDKAQKQQEKGKGQNKAQNQQEKDKGDIKSQNQQEKDKWQEKAKKQQIKVKSNEQKSDKREWNRNQNNRNNDKGNQGKMWNNRGNGNASKGNDNRH